MKPERSKEILQRETYHPNRLINELAAHFKVNNVQQLSFRLNVDGGQLSRIRHRKEVISNNMLVRIMDRTGWTIAYVRERAGLPAED